MKKYLLSFISVITWCFCKLLYSLKLKKELDIPTSIGMSRVIIENPFETYTIKSGNHFCEEKYLKLITTNGMFFNVIFNESAKYTSSTRENQYDINKLWGFSDGFNHELHSARIGWNFIDGKINLHAYAHVGHGIYFRELATVDFGEEVFCHISIIGGNYSFTAKGNEVSIPRATTKAYADGYQLFPYFGGDDVPDHDITIEIR